MLSPDCNLFQPGQRRLPAGVGVVWSSSKDTMKTLTVITIALVATFAISATALSNSESTVSKAATSRAAQIEIALEAAQ